MMAESIRTMNLSDESITILENFYGLIAGIDRDYAALRQALSDANQEQEDLLHEFELSADHLAADGRIILANKMIEFRKRRRQIDNDFQIIDPVLRFTKGHEQLKITIYKLLTDMKKKRDYLNSRQYTPRIRKDIKLYHGKLAKEDAVNE